jgi:hypothetical protein
MRQNTQAIQSSTLQAVTQTMQNELQWASDISDEWAKSIENPSELSTSESWKMSEWYVSAMVARQNEFVQFKAGHLEPQIWQASEQVILVMLSHPWARNWWKAVGQKVFTADFVDVVDGHYEKDVVLVDWASVLKEIKLGST